MIKEETRGSWQLRICGPDDADHTVLLIPGAMCTAAFYDDLVEKPPLSDASIRFIAATVPGFGDARPPLEPTMDGVTKACADLASELGCDAVVGHSMGANQAIEMVATGLFSGPVLLLEPSFCREDEYKVLGTLNTIGRVPAVGQLAWKGMLKTIGRAMKDELPPERHAALAGEMSRGDAGFCRKFVGSYFDYLDEHGSLVSRLCDSGVRALVVFGDRSEIGLKPEERSALEACPSVELVDVADSGHMLMFDQPQRTAELVLELVGAQREAKPA